MNQKIFISVLATTLTTAYFISSYLISGIGKTPLDLEDWEHAEIIPSLEKYDFTGFWFDRSNKFNSAISRFKNNNGTVHLQIRCDPFDYTPFSFANITFDPSTSFWLNILISDGFSMFSANKFLMRVKIPGIKKGQTSISMYFRPSTYFKSQTGSVGLNLTMNINKDRVQRTKLLEDLDINISLSSNEPGSEMDMMMNLKYNNYFNTQGVFRFLTFGFLIGVFEMAVLFFVIMHLERSENACKEQSVVFWTAMGMFNCLFCFINITDSTQNMQNVSYFFINSMINFINFGFVVLRILHRIGKVQLSAILAANVC